MNFIHSLIKMEANSLYLHFMKAWTIRFNILNKK